MEIQETEKFQNELKEHINTLKTLPEYRNDIALKRIVEILNEINSKSDLKKQKSPINHIALDSVENWEIITLIGKFLNTHI
jgi:hypothetical protein